MQGHTVAMSIKPGLHHMPEQGVGRTAANKAQNVCHMAGSGVGFGIMVVSPLSSAMVRAA